MELIPDFQESSVLLRIQNSSKPHQIIDLVANTEEGYFETRGLRELFGSQEIRILYQEFLLIPEYARVISFLLETMSAAQDLNLPYSYQDLFEYEGERYSIVEDSGYRLLKKLEE